VQNGAPLAGAVFTLSGARKTLLAHIGDLRGNSGQEVCADDPSSEELVWPVD
jgi:hypothetical protein